MRENKLNEKVAAKYGKLTEDEIKALVVDDKWLTKLPEDVGSELDRVSHALTDRIAELAKRYETPLKRITAEVAALAARVDDHLKKMVAVWN
jgi:type I restriction enzyme M protein